MQTIHQVDFARTPTRSPENVEALKLLHSLPDAVLVSDAEAALVLNKAQATLARWRAQGKGPMVTRVGTRAIAYTMGDLRRFLGQAG